MQPVLTICCLLQATFSSSRQIAIMVVVEFGGGGRISIISIDCIF